MGRPNVTMEQHSAYPEEVDNYRLVEWLADRQGIDLYRAESSLDGQSATALVVGPHAPPGRKEGLQRAVVVLNMLAKAHPGTVPSVLWAGEMEHGALALVLEAAPGLSLEMLARAEPGHRLEEAQSLRIALEHARLLALMHGEGMSALEQTPSDLFWEPKASRLTALGWPGVQVGLEGAAEDLLTWGETWYRLWLGTPPPDLVDRALQPLSAHPGWQFLSLGTQHVLERSLHPDPAARYAGARDLVADLERHLARYEQTPDDLLVSAFALEEAGDAASALLAVDLACRRRPTPPDDWLTLRAQLVQGSSGQLDRLFDEAKGELELSRFDNARKLLDQAMATSGLGVADRLRVRRWQALAQAARGSLSEIGAFRLALPGFMTALRQAQLGNWDAACSEWDAAMTSLPESARPPGLLDLRHDLHGHRRLSVARQAEQAGQEASPDYQKALELLRQVSYRPELAEPIAAADQRWQELLRQAHRQGTVDRLLREAREALDGGRFARAAGLYEQVLALVPDQPEAIGEAQRGWQVARLRGQAQAVLAELGREAAGLEALAALQRFDPEDAWAREKEALLRERLLNQLKIEPEGPAGPLLQRYFGHEEVAQTALAQAPLWALERTWQAEFQTAQVAAQARTPTGLQDAAASLLGLVRRVDRALVLASAREPSVQAFRQEAEKRWEEVQGLLHQQETLQRRWHTAPLDHIAERREVLLQAQELGLELFNEEERQVDRLQARISVEHELLQLRSWDRALTLADQALKAGQWEVARQGYVLVQSNAQTPAEVQHYVDLALQHLTNLEKLPPKTEQAVGEWRAYLEQLVQIEREWVDRSDRLTAAVKDDRTNAALPSRPETSIRPMALLSLLFSAASLLVLIIMLVSLPGRIRSWLVTAGAPTPPTTGLVQIDVDEVPSVVLADPQEIIALTYRVVDPTNGQAVPNGTRVQFNAVGGLVDPNVTSTVDGVAYALFSPDPWHEGRNEAVIVAQVDGVEKSLWLTLVAPPPPARIEFVDPPSQAIAERPIPLTLLVLDAEGQPIAGSVLLAFRVEPASRGRFEPIQVTTDTAGQAHTVFTPGTEPGLILLVAEVQDAAGLTVNTDLEVLAASDRLQVVASKTRLLATGSDETLLTAQVLDGLGVPGSGVPVTMTLETGDGQFLNSAGQPGTPPWQAIVARTDMSGRVLVRLRAGTSPGELIVRAVAGDQTEQVVLVAEAPAPDTVDIVSESTLVTVGGPPAALLITVLDQVGNPLPGVEVMLSVEPSDSGDIARSVVTDQSGQAVVYFVARRRSETTIITATSGDASALIAFSLMESTPIPSPGR